MAAHAGVRPRSLVVRMSGLNQIDVVPASARRVDGKHMQARRRRLASASSASRKRCCAPPPHTSWLPASIQRAPGASWSQVPTSSPRRSSVFPGTCRDPHCPSRPACPAWSPSATSNMEEWRGSPRQSVTGRLQSGCYTNTWHRRDGHNRSKTGGGSVRIWTSLKNPTLPRSVTAASCPCGPPG